MRFLKSNGIVNLVSLPFIPGNLLGLKIYQNLAVCQPAKFSLKKFSSSNKIVNVYPQTANPMWFL